MTTSKDSTHFSVEIEVGNAAFDGEVEMSREIARILRNLADDVECGHILQTLYDVNGNRVGRASLDN